jgi:hypothetical protein
MKEIVLGAAAALLIMPGNASPVACDGNYCKAVYCWVSHGIDPKFDRCFIYVLQGAEDTTAKNGDNRMCYKFGTGSALNPLEGGTCNEDGKTMEQWEALTCDHCDAGVNQHLEGKNCSLEGATKQSGSPTRRVCVKK